ncbi:hypothetical protein C8J57DRAFT_1377926 [Mycena rebaudengoi]|nr:hypothetical protein C8J57DRAFT_1377926 [Mycena rebaudengoi]
MSPAIRKKDSSSRKTKSPAKRTGKNPAAARRARASNAGSVGVGRPQNPPAAPDWMHHQTHAHPPPWETLDYTCPSDASTPDPDDINWKPSDIIVPVTVGDACRLYCLTEEQLSPLTDHSEWIDLATAAKLALKVHGGFYAHKTLLCKRRDEEEKTLRAAGKDKSDFTYSEMVQKQMNWGKETSDQDMMYEGRGGSTRQSRVAVLYPIKHVCLDDDGYEWEWLPNWGDF